MPDAGLVEQYRDALASSGEISRSALYNNPSDFLRALTRTVITVKDSTSLPNRPELGQLTYLADDKIPKFWDGTQWVGVFNSIEIGLLSGLPTSPTQYQLYYATDTAELFFWDGSAWTTLFPSAGGGGADDALMLMGG